jgi:hypothetical protein
VPRCSSTQYPASCATNVATSHAVFVRTFSPASPRKTVAEGNPVKCQRGLRVVVVCGGIGRTSTCTAVVARHQAAQWLATLARILASPRSKLTAGGSEDVTVGCVHAPGRHAAAAVVSVVSRSRSTWRSSSASDGEQQRTRPWKWVWCVCSRMGTSWGGKRARSVGVPGDAGRRVPAAFQAGSTGRQSSTRPRGKDYS